MGDSRYEPIACGLHDRLEALATVGRVVRIVARAPDGARRTMEDRLVDVFARGGEEFVRTAGGEEIRLDRLESVDGVPYGPSAERQRSSRGPREIEGCEIRNYSRERSRRHPCRRRGLRSPE